MVATGHAPVAHAMGRVLAVLAAIVVGLSVLVAPSLARTARADVAVPKLDARCKDLAQVLSPEERDDLERRMVAYEEATGQQIAILTIPTLEGEAIEDFSYRVAKAWRLGREGKDDGVLITLARKERRVRIEVGKGLEGDLTDLEASLIIRETMKPFTKQERWHDAFAAALAAIETKLSGKAYGPVPKAPSSKRAGDDAVGIFFTALLLGAVFLVILRAIRGGRGGGGRGGGPPIIFFGGWPGGGHGGGGGYGGGGGGWGPPSGGGGDFGGGGASDDV